MILLLLTVGLIILVLVLPSFGITLSGHTVIITMDATRERGIIREASQKGQTLEVVLLRVQFPGAVLGEADTVYLLNLLLKFLE